MRVYSSQKSKLPRLQLAWPVSRRTLSKMKPSQRILLDLETIMEDEDLEDDSDDAGPFDRYAHIMFHTVLIDIQSIYNKCYNDKQ